MSTVDEYRHVLIGGVDEDEDDERNSRISLWGNRARKNMLSLKSKVVSLGMSRDKGNEGKDEVDKAGLEAGLRGGDEGVELTSITARTTSVFESTNPMARDVGKSDLGDVIRMTLLSPPRSSVIASSTIMRGLRPLASMSLRAAMPEVIISDSEKMHEES